MTWVIRVILVREELNGIRNGQQVPVRSRCAAGKIADLNL